MNSLPRNLRSTTIFAALWGLIVVMPIPYGAVEPWWSATFEVTIFLLAALWLFDSFGSGRFLTSQQFWLVAPFVALAVYAFIQTVPFKTQPTPIGSVTQAISADRLETKLFGLKIIALALVLAMLLRYANTYARLIALAYAVIAIALLSSIFGLIREVYQSDAPGFILPSLQKGSGYAQFINKNHFAFLAEMGLGLLLGLVVGQVAARSRALIYLAIALPIWGALVLSGSRGGLLAMIAEVIVVLLLTNVGRRAKTRSMVVNSKWPFAASTLKVVLAAALVFAIAVGMIWIGGEPLANRLSNTRAEITSQPVDNTHVDRASIWAATLRLWRDHPLAGVGFGGYWMAISRYHQASGVMVPQQAHNDYLELAASGGVIGIALLIWFLIVASRQMLEQLQDEDKLRRALALGAATGLFGVAIHSLFDFGLHLPGNAVSCVALTVIATRSFKREKSASPSV